MQFYIFASNEKHIVANIKDAIKSSQNYSEVKDYYNHINSEYRFNNSYLVADFGTFKASGMFSKNTTASLAYIKNNDEMPYFIIAEFHYNPEDNTCNVIDENNGKINLNNAIRQDVVTITSSGFTRIFYNNELALMSFLYYIENKIPAQMYIDFNYYDSTNEKSIILERFLASSIDVLRGGKSQIEKIVLDENQYTAIKQERKFYNFSLKDSMNTDTITAKVVL